MYYVPFYEHNLRKIKSGILIQTLFPLLDLIICSHENAICFVHSKILADLDLKFLGSNFEQQILHNNIYIHNHIHRHNHITCPLDFVKEFAKHYFDSIDIWDFFSSSVDRSITAVCVVVHTVPLISDEILIMLTNINYTSIELEELQKQARVLREARRKEDGGKSSFSENSPHQLRSRFTTAGSNETYKDKQIEKKL